jgi:rod shape-determining protein MreB
MARELALDLGTVTTRVLVRGQGVVLAEPTLAAVDPRTGRVLAVGRAAWALASERPGWVVVHRPVHRGAVTDLEVAERMVRAVLRRAAGWGLSRPRVVVPVGSTLTPVERRALREVVAAAGARSVSLVDRSLAAAVGAGLPVHEATGSMVVDVGGGTTEVAMLSLGGVATVRAVPVGGLDMDAAIQRHLRRTYGLAVGDLTAERVKKEVGSAYPTAEPLEVEVPGRDLATGRARTVRVTSEEVREVLAEAVGAIAAATREGLSESPPELAHDILETGLFLTGGGGLLRGMDMRLARECEVPVHRPDDPLTAVVEGAGRLVAHLREHPHVHLAGGR